MATESHFRILAGIRWQIFRNSLRTKRKKYELAAQIATWTLGLTIAIGVGLALGAFTAVTLGKNKTPAIAGTLWFIFVFWQTAPLFLEGASPTLNFREIARYPVSFRLYYLLHTAYGLLDPAAIQGAIWLVCIWLGIWWARPAWAARAVLAFFIFAALNLFLNRAIYCFFERIMSTRRGRERAIGFLILIGLLTQVVIYVVMPRWGKTYVLPAATALNRISPPGLTAHLVMRWPPATALGELALLACFIALPALILYSQLRVFYRGEITAESAASGGSVQVQPGWKLPFVSDVTSAMIEKEVRYSIRDGRTLMACVAAPLAAFIAALSSDFVQHAFQSFKAGAGALYPWIAGYALLNVGQLAYNLFCYESYGFHRWLLTLPDLRRLLAIKNAMIATLLAAEIAVITLVLSGTRGFSWPRVPVVACGLAFAAIATLTAGNLFSVWFPMRVEYGTMSVKKTSEIAVLLSLLSQSAIMGTFALVLYAAYWLQLAWFTPVAFAAMVLASIKPYLYSLDKASGYVRDHGDAVFASLV